MPVYRDERRTALASRIEVVLSIATDKLVRADLPDVSFEKAADDISRLQRMMIRLRACDLDLLSENNFQSASRFVSEVNDLFSQMQSFSPGRATAAPVAQRNQMLEHCGRLVAEGNDRLLAALAIAGPTLHETDQEVRSIIDAAKSNANQLLTEVKSETDKARKDVEDTLQSVREATGAIGIEEQAKVFKNAAAEHATSRKRWLIATVFLALATSAALVANWIAVYVLPAPSTALSLAQLSIAKVLIFTFLLSAVIWSGKVYRSHQHNYVLNKHRQNALETFQLFARGTNEPEIKSMVLLQATRCIFSPQPTGFLSGDRETDGDGPQILEIIRNLSTTAK